MIAADAMSYYPDLNKPFDIYTDASNYQMGTAIIQDGHPIAYWRKKLTDTQQGYNITEKELLTMVMCMKEYHNILYGGVINVYTDHENLTFHTLSAPRVMRWKLFLEQYDMNLTYVSGQTNILADCFLRLPRMDGPSSRKNEENRQVIDFRKLVVPKDDEDVFISTREEVLTLLPSICGNKDVDIIEPFMNLPALSNITYPLTVANIQQHQAGNQVLVHTALVQFLHYPIKIINGRNLMCYRVDPNVVDKNDWKVYLLQSIIQDVIRWYHMILGLLSPRVTRILSRATHQYGQCTHDLNRPLIVTSKPNIHVFKLTNASRSRYV